MPPPLPASPAQSRKRRDLRSGRGTASALHVFALWGFAVAQPLLDLLGRHPQFFVTHDSRPSDVAGLALVLCFGLPAALALAERLAALLVSRAARALRLLLVAFLVAATCLPVVRGLGQMPGGLWVAAALALGAAAAALYDRSPTFRTYLSLLAPAPLVFAAIFLFFSPAAPLVWPEPRPGPAAPAVDADVPVVLVVFDELPLPTLMDPSHRIDADRYPHFAALSERSHWFRNATTTSEATTVALPAILTGRYLGGRPGGRHLATPESYPDNLFTLLGASYRMNVFEPTTRLCPRELCGPTVLDASAALRLRQLLTDAAVVYPHGVLPADLAAGLPNVTNQWGNFVFFARKHLKRARWREMDRKPRIFAAFLQAIRDQPGTRGKALHFLHLSLPHRPWQYLPSGRSYGRTGSGLVGADGLHQELWDADPWPALQGFQRYLLQLGYVDRLLGDLVATLEETGLWDPALVIVCSDHGASFRPGISRRRIGRDNFQDIMPVPLFVKLPFQRHGVLSDRNVELVDVLPTIADVLGFAVPWPTDGASAIDPRLPERRGKRIFRDDRRSQLVFETAELEDKYRTVERMERLFGPSSDPRAIYRIGPRGGLVGRVLAELEVTPEPRAEVRLKRPELYRDVDPASGLIPARVVGEIRAPELDDGPLELAVAMSGKIEAVTRTLEADGQRAPFAAMVPESAFVPGRNAVEVFLISGPTARPRLTPTKPFSSSDWP